MIARSFPLFIGATLAATVPEQIHISVTGRVNEMAVDFVAFDAAQTVTYNPGTMSVAANCSQQTLNTYTAFFCTAVMNNLAPSTRYNYSISGASGTTAQFSFFNGPYNRPEVFAIYADFGLGNDESITYLYKSFDEGAFDYVIHAGDFAYNFDSDNSATGNGFMNSIQPYAANVPYMVSPGNHEAYGTQGGGNFTQFRWRNRAVEENAGAVSGSNSNFWYSFNTPYTHWIAYCAESWTMSADQLAAQQAFVTKDLTAVDRSVTPWVVAFSHKAYMMDQTTWAMHDFITTFKVDWWFCGHWHQYTRYPPISSLNNKVVIDSASISADKSVYTNPLYPTLVVTGAPGDIEVNPEGCNEEWQIYCNSNYGFGFFTIFNNTHSHWFWNTTIPVKGGNDLTFSDSLWIIKQ